MRSRKYWADTQRNYRRKLRLYALMWYGGACSCCGENRSEFLAIDHVDGGGTQHRKEIGRGMAIHQWLRRNHYPEGFQVLCHNCNQAKARGLCPHQQFIGVI